MVERMVRLTVDMTVNEGQLDKFMSIAETMTAGCRKEPGTLGYDWFSSGDKKRFRLVETYGDADAVLAHFTGPVVQELVPKLAAVCSVTGFEVYGDPGQKVSGDGGGIRGGDLRILDGHQPLSLCPAEMRIYCFSRSMLSYSWRAMASRIWAGVLPALVMRYARNASAAQSEHSVPCAFSKQLRRLVWPRERSQRQLQGN